MVDQIRLFKTAGLGDFAALLRAVTIDPAMLIYLDGGDSTAAAPNENYGREVMELFTLGVGNYSEDEVAIAARAWTGYNYDRVGLQYEYRADRHDSTPGTFFGVTDAWTGPKIIDAIFDTKGAVVARFESRR